MTPNAPVFSNIKYYTIHVCLRGVQVQLRTIIGMIRAATFLGVRTNAAYVPGASSTSALPLPYETTNYAPFVVVLSLDPLSPFFDLCTKVFKAKRNDAAGQFSNAPGDGNFNAFFSSTRLSGVRRCIIRERRILFFWPSRKWSGTIYRSCFQIELSLGLVNKKSYNTRYVSNAFEHTKLTTKTLLYTRTHTYLK